VASAAGVAAIGLYVSRALPGHRSTQTGATAASAGATSAGSSAGVSPTVGNSSACQSGTNLAPPNNPQAQTQQPSPVVSGST
jgi:hypothetical protein